MTYTPKHLRLYRRPECYIGPTYFDYYPFLGQSRDSDALERSNFACGLELIGGESETVLVIRDHHWAVGWVETIYIHQSDEHALRKADEITERLANYPVVDESHYSDLEFSEVAEYWARSSVRDRLDAIKHSRASVSPFAARHDYLPRDDNGALYDYLRA